MVKNNKYTNKLIKRKNLVFMLKKHGINRANKEALELIGHEAESRLDKIFDALKEEMLVHGSKTLKKEDVKRVFSKKENFWEI